MVLPVYYDVFNDKLDEFFKDLITTFPSVAEFKRFRSGFTLMKNLDPKYPRNVFNTNFLTIYRESILQMDEGLFTNKNNVDGILNNIYNSNDNWLDFMNKISSLWHSLNKENKIIIWKYFGVLLFLSDKCS